MQSFEEFSFKILEKLQVQIFISAKTDRTKSTVILSKKLLYRFDMIPHSHPHIKNIGFCHPHK
jgi:hypothetical protein